MQEFDKRLGHHVLGIGGNKKGVTTQAAGSSRGMENGQSLMGDDDGIPGFGTPLMYVQCKIFVDFTFLLDLTYSK